jgi:hypothetical protein
MFGSYEPVSELYLSGLGAVWTARRTGEGSTGEAAFAVKTCQPDPAIVGDAEARRAIAEFLGQARVMQDAARVAAGLWAPVHEFGEFRDGSVSGAYYATDLAASGSAAKLVAGRVKLDARSLAGLLEGVVDGLRALRASGGRAHGNLKPTNVLLPGKGGPLSGGVRLADPLAPARADLARDERADARGLGELIAQLVTFAPTRGVWPLPGGPAWTALGPSGATFRELASRLLDPGGKPPTLDELALSVRELQRMRAPSSKTPLIAAGTAVALAAVGGLAWFLTRGSPSGPAGVQTPQGAGVPSAGDQWDDQARARWVELCTSYRSWYRDFARDLDLRPPTPPVPVDKPFTTRRELYALLAPELAPALDPVKIAPGADPWSIAGVSADTDPVTLSQNPSPQAMSPTGVAKTRAALDTVRAVASALGDDWAVRKLLLEQASAFESRGWTAAGAALRSRAQNAAPGKSPSLAQAIDGAIFAGAQAARVAERWSGVEAKGKLIAESGDAVLAKVPTAAAAIVAAGVAPEEQPLDAGAAPADPLDRLARAVESVGELAARLEGFLKSEREGYDLAGFAQSPAFATLAAGTPRAETFENWLFEVKGFPSLDPTLDPRRAWDVPDLVKQVQDQARTLAGTPLSSPVDAATAQRLDDLAAEAAKLEPRALPWTKANQPVIAEAAPRVRKALEDLRVDLEGRIDRRRGELGATAADIKARLSARDTIVASSSAVNAAWRSWRDRLVASESDPDQLRTKAAALEDALAQGERAFPQRPAFGRADYSIALAEAADQERERRLAAAVEVLGANPPDPAAARRALSSVAAEFEGWLKTLADLDKQLGVIAGALDTGAGPADKLAGDAQGRTLSAAFEAVGGTAVAREPGVAKALAVVGNRLTALQRLGGERDVARLVQTIQNAGRGQEAQALAAWRRLLAPELSWPATPEHLVDAPRLREALTRIAGAVDAAAGNDLRRQIDTEFPARWRAFMDKAAASRDIEAALARFRDFAVAPASFDPRTRFNAALLGVRQRLAQTPPDDDARGLVGQLQDIAKRLPAGDQARAKPLLDALEAAMKAPAAAAPTPPRAEGPNPTTLGPARAGFTGTLEADGTLTFKRGNTTLSFVRLDATGSFIQATELSLGQFADIVAAANAWPTVQQQMSPGEYASWRGPRVWVYDTRGAMVPARPGWIFADPNINAGNPAYPPELLGGGGPLSLNERAGGDPSRDHPMQSVPAAAARAVAALAGSRFPTVDEFKAALAQFASGGANLQGANLRDQTFAAEVAHITRMRANPRLTLKTAFPYPDEEIFVPAGANPPSGEDAQTRGWSDGILFFDKVTTGSDRVKHLIGNVAEFVGADAGGSSLAVVGGSALSPPDAPVDQPKPLDPADAAVAFTDVGFRLAFSATGAPPAVAAAPAREPLAPRLLRALGDDPYLKPAR